MHLKKSENDEDAGADESFMDETVDYMEPAEVQVVVDGINSDILKLAELNGCSYYLDEKNWQIKKSEKNETVTSASERGEKIGDEKMDKEGKEQIDKEKDKEIGKKGNEIIKKKGDKKMDKIGDEEIDKEGDEEIDKEEDDQFDIRSKFRVYLVPEDNLQEGVKHLQEGDYSQALNIFKKEILIYSEEYVLRSKLHFKNHNLQCCIADLKVAIQIEPFSKLVCSWLKFLYNKSKR
ncbi:uncharacterized protein LOC129218916 [Uloborus diversus]|uniref:uncharacterized protein LOC129218916 n=1 Tax=Uloborus diversus TaxID=327109 RepID=UPI002408FC76|nr:uncharacterized protein LOC129218916 [Uloborus diversus]